MPGMPKQREEKRMTAMGGAGPRRHERNVMDHRLIVNPATAARLEQLGWAENRDFLVSEPLPSDFPFPLAEPTPEPVQIMRPCGCRSMEMQPGATPMQVSWCAQHDPGYPLPQEDLRD